MNVRAQRIVTLDVIRGFAVCGILAMNIVSMAMPAYAYIDPHYYGGASGADMAAWAIAYALVDGKMRALFTMLFGASMLLITDAAEGHAPGPARVHYSRIFWLFVFGMIHAWLVWYGDILVEYAICGAILFVARKWRLRALAFTAFCLLLYDGLQSVVQWHDLSILQRIATGPHPPADAVRDWGKVLAQVTPTPERIGREVTLYRGGFDDVFAVRAAMTKVMQFQILPATVPETLGFMILGMLLYRLGFWTGHWSKRGYAWILGAGAVTLPLYVPILWAIVAHDFNPAFLPLTDALSLALRPFLALAYAAGLILMVQAGAMRWLAERLAAAGRMAFSNYLGTSLVMTTLFYGYGLGLFGSVPRAELYLFVAAQWVVLLGWSKPWLLHFHYGPLEWLWRVLARGRGTPLRRAIAS